MGKPSSTSATVTTHLRLAAIGIEELPFEISFFRPFDEDDAIRTHRNSPAANLLSKPFHPVSIEKRLSMIDQDKIVSTTAHFHKRNLHFSLSIVRREELGVRRK
jgi:hypothetical protein